MGPGKSTEILEHMRVLSILGPACSAGHFDVQIAKE